MQLAFETKLTKACLSDLKCGCCCDPLTSSTLDSLSADKSCLSSHKHNS